MHRVIALALASTIALALPAAAQGLGGIDQISFDAGLGVTYGPEYPGSEDNDASPWFILRNVTLGTPTGEKEGLTILPSVNYVGERDASDHDRLTGLDDIDRAGELGLKLSYVGGPFTSYGTVRKGFGGHHGLVGEIGTRYRYIASDRLTLWTGVELQLGDSDFTETYFGITSREAMNSQYAAYTPDGGAYAAQLSVEARYMLTPETSILGKISYGHLIGDAADSPIVGDKNQPSVSIGVARKLNFRF